MCRSSPQPPIEPELVTTSRWLTTQGDAADQPALIGAGIVYGVAGADRLVVNAGAEAVDLPAVIEERARRRAAEDDGGVGVEDEPTGSGHRSEIGQGSGRADRIADRAARTLIKLDPVAGFVEDGAVVDEGHVGVRGVGQGARGGVVSHRDESVDLENLVLVVEEEGLGVGCQHGHGACSRPDVAHRSRGAGRRPRLHA
jgi:hypothetical protein